MVFVDIVIKEERGRFSVTIDSFKNRTPEQAVTILRKKYDVMVGFPRFLERMDDLIWKLDDKLVEEFALIKAEWKEKRKE